MSFVRASEKMRFSNYDEPLYVFLSGDPRDGDELFIEDYRDLGEGYTGLRNPEVFCEIMFRVLDQAGVDFDLEMVNKVRDRLHLEPLEKIGNEYEISEEFKEIHEEVKKAKEECEKCAGDTS